MTKGQGATMKNAPIMSRNDRSKQTTATDQQANALILTEYYINMMLFEWCLEGDLAPAMMCGK